MLMSKRGAAALVTVLPLALGVGVAGSAAAAHAPASTSNITASVSDTTPASGKAFTISGTFTVNNQPAALHEVKIQTKTAGTWKTLAGAHDQTTAKGVYKLKVILNSTGVRKLRAVGVGQGDEPNARQVFKVTVH